LSKTIKIIQCGLQQNSNKNTGNKALKMWPAFGSKNRPNIHIEIKKLRNNVSNYVWHIFFPRLPLKIAKFKI
jgi:hypothetical protein